MFQVPSSLQVILEDPLIVKPLLHVYSATDVVPLNVTATEDPAGVGSVSQTARMMNETSCASKGICKQAS